MLRKAALNLGEDHQMIKNELDVGDNSKLADKQQGLLINDGNISLTDDQHTENITDLFFFDDQGQADINTNHRITTRIIRDGIAVHINQPFLFGFGKTIPADLIDISCKGVLVSTHQKLRINKKITLTLLFESGKLFKINAIVVRRSDSTRNEYGIKFVQNNNELGECLYESQEKVIFK
jgi:hypothetical protein